MPIKDLPDRFNPRKKAFSQGVESLDDISLIALFLRFGYEDLSVMDIATDLIGRYKELRFLKDSSIRELKSIPGISGLKALELMAVVEFSRRVNQVAVEHVRDEESSINLALNLISKKDSEEFLFVGFDKYMNLTQYKILYTGTKYSVNIDPREILGFALKTDTEKFYCFHNHPSGNIQASKADELMTRRLQNYCDLFEVELLGHFIVNKKGDYLPVGI